MGQVYKAHDPRLERDVAIKVLPEDTVEHPKLQRRFERELHAISRLNHKNICTIYDTGQHNGEPFIVMELLEGETLESVLKSGPIPIDRLLGIGIQVADALDAAHRQDIVHRDIKSANIFLTSRGDAKVLDFGVAKVNSSPLKDSGDVDTALTDAGMTIGTVAFMSPEQAYGSDVDARSDLFSLGVVMYQMATGHLPYTGSPVSVLSHLTNSQPVPSVLSRDPSLPPELARIISRAVEKDRDVRYQTARDLLAALRGHRRSLESTPSVAWVRAAPNAAWSFRGWSRTKRSIAVLIAATVAVVSGIGLASSGRGMSPPFESIAVLPCSSTDGDASVDFLCDQLTESLISSLSGLPDLEVKSFPIVLAYRGRQDVMAVGQELGVDAVLTMHVNQNLEELQLALAVTDTETGAHILGRSFRSPASERNSLQEAAIALDVTEELRLRLSATERARLAVQQIYQQALYYWNQRSSASLPRAITLFEEAVSEDPQFARAYAGLASAYVLLPYYGGSPPAEAYTKARRAAEQALRLDESLADAHSALGLVRRDYERNWQGAEEEFSRAIELDPQSGLAHQWYAELLNSVGRFDEAVDQIEEAQRAIPLSLSIRAVHAWILICAGRTQEASDQLERTLQLDPTFALTHWVLGQLHVLDQDFEAAIGAFEEARRFSSETSLFLANLGSAYGLSGDRTAANGVLERLRGLTERGVNVTRYEYALVYAGLGDHDQAISELDAALEERSHNVVALKVDPMLRSLHEDPRYASLVRRMGLPF